MEAEPPLWKKITTSIMSDPLPSPMPAGLVLRGPNKYLNASRLAEKIRDILPEGTNSSAEKAIAYVKAKYPLLTSKLTGGINTTDVMPFDTTESSPELYGQYMTNRKAISIAPKGHDKLDTLGHELTHAVQDMRGQRVPARSKFPYRSEMPPMPAEGEAPTGGPQPIPSMSGPGLGRPEVSPFKARRGQATLYEKADQRWGYDENPFEQQAKVGGAGVRDTADNFHDKLDFNSGLTGHYDDPYKPVPYGPLPPPIESPRWDVTRDRLIKQGYKMPIR